MLYNFGNSMNKSHKKIIVFIFGIIFAFCISELFLRFFYFLKTDQTGALEIASSYKSSKFKILFLGNSHTFGAGVKKEAAYPAVLQKFFDKNLQGKAIRVGVYNGGIPNVNTYEINRDLDAVLRETRPDLAFIMSGEPNIWNKNGYNEYAIQKNEKPRSGIINFLVKMGEYSKTIRWIMSFQNLTQKNILSAEQEDENLVYKEIAAVEKTFYDSRPKTNESDRLKIALERYIQKHTNDPPKDAWRAILYCLVRLNYYTYGDSKTAYNLVQKSIQFDIKKFDMYSYLFLKEIIQKDKSDSENVVQAKSIFNQLQKHPEFPGLVRIEEIFKYAIVGERSGDPRFGLDYEIIRQSLQLFKILSVVALESANYQKKALAEYAEANMTLIETFKSNPFSFKANLSFAILEMASDRNHDNTTRQLAREIIQNFPLRFPAEKYFFDQEQSEKQTLFNWIRWGTIETIQKMKNYDVPLVVQNYHWIRERVEADTVNEAIESAAQDQKSLFLDTHSGFMKMIESEPNNVESFFISKYGFKDSHPSEKGHRVIAYLIYKYMVEKKLLPAELLAFDPEEILKMD